MPFVGQLVCPIDICLLGRLVSAAQQQDQVVAVLQVVDPVARAVGQSQFRHPMTDRFGVAGVAVDEPVDTLQDPQSEIVGLELPDASDEHLRRQDFDHVSTIADSGTSGKLIDSPFSEMWAGFPLRRTKRPGELDQSLEPTSDVARASYGVVRGA